MTGIPKGANARMIGLQALEGAILNAKKALMHDQNDHCHDRSIRAPSPKGRAALPDFKTVTKYL